ncbi:TetR/AcrR family transcriptional regulator C-terminal domain-containing protein [Oscillospiraceae bacterium 50-58]
MPNHTKRAIKEAFITLLNDRPLNRITVKDIVETCGINRNSFYYHYEDLPALMEEIIAGQVEELIQAHPTIDSLENCFDAALEFVLQNRRAVLHIYNSISRDVFERYLMDVCFYVVKTYVETDFAGQPVDEQDREMLIRYHKCECFGNIIDWLNGGMKDDISVYFHRIYQLKRGWEGGVLHRDVKA